MKQPRLTVTARIEVPIDRIVDTLVGAFEGGSYYWMTKISWGEAFREEHAASPFKDKPCGSVYSDVLKWAFKEEKHFSIMVSQEFSEHGCITPQTIQRGVEIMARDYRSHFDDMLQENDDATTSDVLLQCIIFCEVVFG